MKHLTKVTDLSAQNLFEIFCDTYNLQEEFIRSGQNTGYFKNKCLAMLFEKPSLRTRMAFTVASAQLGGQAMALAKDEVLLDGSNNLREPVSDISKNLSLYADLIFARVYLHDVIEELAKNSQVPVINGLSDLHHPTQAIADMYIVWSLFKDNLKNVKFVFVGDPCNVATSLLLACEILDINFTISFPAKYSIPMHILSLSQGKFTVEHNPKKAVKDADIVYTDTWVSMGLEHEMEQRIKDFQDYQLNSDLLQHAKSTARVMHCLPAHRGHEITGELMDGSKSLILQQAQAKMLTAKAIIKFLTTYTCH